MNEIWIHRKNKEFFYAVQQELNNKKNIKIKSKTLEQGQGPVKRC